MTEPERTIGILFPSFNFNIGIGVEMFAMVVARRSLAFGAGTFRDTVSLRVDSDAGKDLRKLQMGLIDLVHHIRQEL